MNLLHLNVLTNCLKGLLGFRVSECRQFLQNVGEFLSMLFLSFRTFCDIHIN